MDAKHPKQPLVVDEEGVTRFLGNTVVQYLLDHGGLDLNRLAAAGLPREDWVQFNQLIGYSLDGWADLDCVTAADYAEATAKAPGTLAAAMARNAYLEGQISRVRDTIRLLRDQIEM